MKQKIIPIVSIVIGILAGVLTYQYIQGERRKLKLLEEKIYAGANKIGVMVAARNIPAGTTLKVSDLGTRDEFERVVEDRAVPHKQGKVLLGRKTLLPIKKDSPIMWADIEGGRSGEGLASIVTMKMRAVSLTVGGANSVSSMVQPDDRVDVLGTFSFPSQTVAGEMESVTLTILQDVTVLATGQLLARDMISAPTRRGPPSYNSVTLEVTPREAELLVFAQQLQGRITLTLRNRGDLYFEHDLPSVDFKYLESKLPELNEIRQRTIVHGP